MNLAWGLLSRVRALYETGLTIGEVAQNLGVGIRTVTAALRATENTPRAQAQRDLIEACLGEGMTVAWTARAVGCHPPLVNAILRERDDAARHGLDTTAPLEERPGSYSYAVGDDVFTVGVFSRAELVALLVRNQVVNATVLHAAVGNARVGAAARAHAARRLFVMGIYPPALEDHFGWSEETCTEALRPARDEAIVAAYRRGMTTTEIRERLEVNASVITNALRNVEKRKGKQRRRRRPVYDRQQIRELAAEGKPARQIASIVGCCALTVRRLAPEVRHAKSGPKRSPQKIARAKELHATGMHFAAIAREVGAHPSSVREWLSFS
jgi:transposase